MAKKRKQTPQTATLHDFFSRPAPLRENKNKKPKIETPAVSSKQKKQAWRAPLSHEVIVIDDESDEEVEVEARVAVDPRSAVKREKLSPSSGMRTDDDPIAFGQPSLLLPAVASPPKDASERGCSLFGDPFLLLAPDAPSRSSHDAPSSTNGSIKLEVVESRGLHYVTEADPSRLKKVEEHSSSVDSVPPIVGPSRINMDMNVEIIDIDEDWAMGDDELDVSNTDVKAEPDGFGGIDVDLTLDDTESPMDPGSSDAQDCPLCGKHLAEFDIMAMQEHVNRCIDGLSSPMGRAPANSSRPLFPLQPSYLRACPPSMEGSGSKISDGADSSNLFSRMKLSYQENEAWKEASVAEETNYRLSKGHRGRRKAPFYKVMQGMPIAVDAFRYGTIPGVTAYFLTHAHSDHYTNLSSNWKSGPIYCSEGTANLIAHMLEVDRKWVHPLPMDVPTVIPDTGGVSVTLIEANHCPGSCLFLFEGPQTVNAGDSAFKSPFVGTARMFRYLHCGDFRASPQHVLHPAINRKRLDYVYLDTTYLDPKYCFPPQPQVVSACAELARRIVMGQPLRDPGDPGAKECPTMDKWVTVQEKSSDKKDEKPGKVLVVVGTYSIGKERIVKAIARALQTQVYCDSRKTAILRCQSDPELHSLLTTDPIKAGIHLVPLAVIASDRLKSYVERWKDHFSKAVGFRPTGWTYSPPAGGETMPAISSVIARSQGRTFTHAHLTPMKNSTSALQVYGVPYSEHSSFFELTCFALSLDWVKMIATVNVGSENSRRKMAKWIERWEVERKKKGAMEIVSHRAEDYW